MSGAFKGRQITLEWNGVEILGLREKGVALGGDPIDITSDEDGGWRTLLSESSQNQVDISISGVVKSQVLKRDWFTGNRTQTCRIEYPDGGVIEGTFYLATYNETGTYNDATTFDGSLQSTGVVSYIPYS